MHSPIRFVPDLIECRIVVCSRPPILKTFIRHTSIKHGGGIPLEDRLPRAAALLPCTSELGEFVRGIRTSQIPISKS